ncbi:hypothetical protein ARSEF4850_000584 [Beauveria asiatica]
MSSNTWTAPVTPPAAMDVSSGQQQSSTPMSRPAHSMSSEETLKELRADASSGLSSNEAEQRLASIGRNELEQKKGVQPLKILLEQIFNAMTMVLLVALAASFGIRAWIEGGILSGIIVFNIFIGYLQTLQAERTIDSLRTLGSPTCNVFRDGATVTIPTAEVVPGDIVHLSTGDSVPADIRLFEAVNLEADEALLTGEAAPVLKMPALVFDVDTGPGDRLNVVFSSTTVTKGRGRGVVFATGMSTEIGLIARALETDGKAAVHDTAATDSLFKRAWKSATRVLGQFFGLTVGTPLQRKLAKLFLGLLGFAIICAIIVLGANKFNAQTDVILYAVTTAIGTIPVALLLVLTVTMAAGTKKMLQRHVIVRNLSSLEALGGVTNVCSDKTGTITQGRMVVRKAWLPATGTYSVETTNDVYNPTVGHVSFTNTEPKDMGQTDKSESFESITPTEHVGATPALQWYLNVASLANLATLEQGDDSEEKDSGEWKARGAPTEIAIEVFASRFGWNRIVLSEGPSAKWNHIAEFPFDSDVKKMSVLFRDTESQQIHVFTKGAVERVLDICTKIAFQHEVRHLTAETKDNILANMDALASQGLRVLALAHKVNETTTTSTEISASDFASGATTTTTSPSRDAFEHSLVFRGLVGIYDPPRPESAPSVRAFHEAGIAVHMLTGDHPQTAYAIAQDVGILPASESSSSSSSSSSSLMTTAQRFDALSDAQIDELPQLPLVVARCAPSTKVRMIEALHRRGKYVAMTGDGVNDSPSLKRADIGIAMGTGSDVAKESSDIVLTDDNFASILNAIEEGRRIFDNIQKFLLHVLAANLGFVISLLVGLSFKDHQGVSVFLLSPVEILWMLLGTGAFSETGLGFERAVPDILNRPPHNLKYGVFTPELVLDIVIYGILMAGCVLGSFTVIIFGFDNGNLGVDCNNRYSTVCDEVFRARATCYATMTWIFLLFSWELIDFRRSMFYMPRGIGAWTGHLWSNKFLFFSVTVVFAIVFPTIYIPGLNHVVFLHTGITWEWAVVFISVGVWMAGTESWKWMKRTYFRRTAPKTETSPGISVV